MDFRTDASDASRILPRYRCGRTCVAGWFSMSLVLQISEGDGRSGRKGEVGMPVLRGVVAAEPCR